MRMTRLLALGAACAVTAFGAAGPAAAAPAGKVITVKITDFVFGGKKNLKLTAHVGDTLRFVWAGTAGHNVDLVKGPAGVKKVKTPVVVHRAPLLVKLSKKGTYLFVCVPHRVLGMTATVTVK